MKVVLDSEINSRTARVGDRFIGQIASSGVYLDGKIEGHVSRLNKSSRETGNTELSIEFDSIVLRSGKKERFNARLHRAIVSNKIYTVDKTGEIKRPEHLTIIHANSGKTGGGMLSIDGDKDLVLAPGAELLIEKIL